MWFRRQVPLERFIADFTAPSARLVVKVDGAYYVTRRAADARRDRRLRRMGYRVLRLDAELVRSDVQAAIALIRGALE
jgi:very-short-patch-repair endonuclease